MIDKFWIFMDSATGFWALIFGTVLAGIIYLRGVSKLINWLMAKRGFGSGGRTTRPILLRWITPKRLRR